MSTELQQIANELRRLIPLSSGYNWVRVLHLAGRFLDAAIAAGALGGPRFLPVRLLFDVSSWPDNRVQFESAFADAIEWMAENLSDVGAFVATWPERNVACGPPVQYLATNLETVARIIAPETASQGTSQTQGGVALRNDWFLDQYLAEGTDTFHHPEKIRQKWNAMKPAERAKICPESILQVEKHTVVTGYKRAQKRRRIGE